MKKLLVGFLILFISATASAATQKTAAGSITKMNLGSTGDLFLFTSATKINPAACTSGTYLLEKSFDAFNAYYAMLLTASATGTNVVLRINTTTCTSGGYPLIQGIENPQ